MKVNGHFGPPEEILVGQIWPSVQKIVRWQTHIIKSIFAPSICDPTWLTVSPKIAVKMWWDLHSTCRVLKIWTATLPSVWKPRLYQQIFFTSLALSWLLFTVYALIWDCAPAEQQGYKHSPLPLLTAVMLLTLIVRLSIAYSHSHLTGTLTASTNKAEL